MTLKPRLLDLFCGAGGAAMGYKRAGFDTVVGIDVNPQKHYPDEFIQADLTTARVDVDEYGGRWLKVGNHSLNLSAFGAVHASPPCQHYSSLARLHRDREYPDLIAPTRELLQTTGLPYVIENVPGAPLRFPLVLCGSQFGLPIRRHRLFESTMLLMDPGPHHHRDTDIAVTGHSVVYAWHSRKRRSPHLGWARAREAMGIDWCTYTALAQAVPPVYTEWIGRQMLAWWRAAA